MAHRENLILKISGGNSKSRNALSINAKTGAVTIKKNTKKGKYTIKVKITASGSQTYATKTKTVNVKVYIK